MEDLDEEMHEELDRLIAPFFQEDTLKLQDSDALSFELFKVSGSLLISSP